MYARVASTAPSLKLTLLPSISSIAVPITRTPLL